MDVIVLMTIKKTKKNTGMIKTRTAAMLRSIPNLKKFWVNHKFCGIRDF